MKYWKLFTGSTLPEVCAFRYIDSACCGLVFPTKNIWLNDMRTGCTSWRQCCCSAKIRSVVGLGVWRSFHHRMERLTVSTETCVSVACEWLYLHSVLLQRAAGLWCSFTNDLLFLSHKSFHGTVISILRDRCLRIFLYERRLKPHSFVCMTHPSGVIHVMLFVRVFW